MIRSCLRTVWFAVVALGLLQAGPAHEAIHHLTGHEHQSSSTCGHSHSDEDHEDPVDAHEGECPVCALALGAPPTEPVPPLAHEWVHEFRGELVETVEEGARVANPPLRGPPETA